jgi:arginyl-tRNA synthetase
MPAPLSPFKQAAVQAVASALGVDASILMVTQPPDAAMGDLAVGCFPAAKALKAAPAQLAQQAAAAFQPGELLASATAAGPYVNFKLERGALYRWLFEAALAREPKLLPESYGAGKTVCVDFSSPNIAKQLAYHHIRSTVLGHALVNLHRALGFKVVGINHLGDWGTTFGMIIAAIQEWGAPEPFDIEAMNALYVRFRAAAKEDKSFEDKGRQWFKKLEDGDEIARALWQRIRDVSWNEFNQIYQLLDVHFDEVRGEAAYEHAMQGVIDMLGAKGLTSISDDALVVDLSGDNMPPLLLRKSDGATLYATRDLTAAMYRWETYHFDKSLYVVGKGQALHFKQLFRVLEKAGFEWAKRLVHVPFGIVRIGGKMAATRLGNVVRLRAVLEEAQAKVAAEIAEKNPGLDGERRNAVARDVGVGAVVFANLASQREKDVDFEMDQVTSFSGDAAPYVQYAHARTAGILRKAGAAANDLAGADVGKLTLPEEWALARLLSELADVCAGAAEALEPHHITRYLLDVCAAYSRWYALGNDKPELRVVCDDAEVSRARLALNAATRETLRVGLKVLGIGAPDEM